MIINIATTATEFQPGQIIKDNNQFFENNVEIGLLGKEEEIAMQKIDHAQLVDKNTGNITTPYGSTDISNLSLGCKTVINYIWIKKNPSIYQEIQAILATEAGYNALEAMFEFMENFQDEKTIIVVEHDDELFRCKDRTYCIDGKRIINSMFDF